MEDAERIEAILAQSNSTDIPILIKAKEDAKRLVRDEPSAQNLAALERATRMLREARLGMENNDGFSKVKDILDYLTGGQGRKVSQSQLYKDIKAGYLIRQKDGAFRRLDVDRYAQTLPALGLPDKAADELSGMALDELREKVAKNRAQRLNLELDRDIKLGKYVPREDVAAELAARASVLSLGLRSVFALVAPEMIEIVGGDANRVDAMVDLFERNLDAALNEYSRPMEFRVEYVPDVPSENGASGELNEETDDGDEGHQGDA